VESLQQGRRRRYAALVARLRWGDGQVLWRLVSASPLIPLTADHKMLRRNLGSLSQTLIAPPRVDAVRCEGGLPWSYTLLHSHPPL
jgi:hypothetical protein